MWLKGRPSGRPQADGLEAGQAGVTNLAGDHIIGEKGRSGQALVKDAEENW